MSESGKTDPIFTVLPDLSEAERAAAAPQAAAAPAAELKSMPNETAAPVVDEIKPVSVRTERLDPTEPVGHRRAAFGGLFSAFSKPGRE